MQLVTENTYWLLSFFLATAVMPLILIFVAIIGEKLHIDEKIDDEEKLTKYVKIGSFLAFPLIVVLVNVCMYSN